MQDLLEEELSDQRVQVMRGRYDATGEFSQAICKNIAENLEARTTDFRLGDGFETTTNSVLSSLLARQAALNLGLAESPLTWSGHIAPIVLRSMIDLLITFKWILIEPSERALEYVNYGLGSEKLLTAHYQKRISEGNTADEVAEIARSNLAWIESQQFHMFVKVNLGSWAGRSVRQMCKETGDEDLYNFSFTPFSAATHNMWNHVGKWNSRVCSNPLHKQHAVGVIADVWPIPDFLFRACKYFELVIDEFDAFYGFETSVRSPIGAFEDHIDTFVEAWNSSDEDHETS